MRTDIWKTIFPTQDLINLTLLRWTKKLFCSALDANQDITTNWAVGVSSVG